MHPRYRVRRHLFLRAGYRPAVGAGRTADRDGILADQPVQTVVLDHRHADEWFGRRLPATERAPATGCRSAQTVFGRSS